MTRRRTLLTLLSALGLSLLPPLTAGAATDDDVVRHLDIEIEIDDDGLAHVTETYRWDFGGREGLGFTRDLNRRFDYGTDHDRLYRYDDFAVSSPSGAPAQVWTREQGARTMVDVGAPDGSDDTRTGVQTYELGYTVEGVLNAIRGEAGVSDQDEFYWNATGTDWEVSIESVSVQVHGPTDVVDSACYEGPADTDDECASRSVDGSSVSFTAGPLAPGSGLTIMTAYPAGTFGDISPILVPVQRSGSQGSVFRRQTNPVPAIAVIAVTVAGSAVYGIVRVRRNRDLAYAGVTPGTIPGDHERTEVRQLTSEPPVAVRFTPPDWLTPAEVGALRSRTLAPDLAAATIISLATRGYLRIEEAESGFFSRHGDWRLIATPDQSPAEHLLPHESYLLGELFRGGPVVTISSLRHRFAERLRQTSRLLGEEIDRKGLFTRPLRPSGSASGLLTVIPFLFAVFMFQRVLGHFALIGTTLTVVFATLLGGLGFLLTRSFTRRRAQQRSAVGRALYEQTRGFELYISTAEAEQLRWEEGEDIFSRYLPYAIVFGVAERWAQVFERLAQQGRYTASPTWYASPTGRMAPGSYARLGTAMSSFARTTSSSLSSTPGSSGGSGSRSGGGGGGRVGGGGGGGGGRGR